MPHLPIDLVLNTLDELYDPPRSFLHHRTPFDLAIVTVLSAQCTDARVNLVSKTLYKKYSTPRDYLSVSREELEQDIRSCGKFRNKARFIQETCAILLEKYDGELPQTMEELTALPGIGRKTAAIILWVAFGKREGIAVDTHVLRLARRLGLTKKKSQDGVEKDLMHMTPRERWGDLNPLFISHGRAVCTARNRQCEKCVFRKECPSSSVMKRTDKAQ